MRVSEVLFSKSLCLTKSQKQEMPYAWHSASWSVGVTLDGLKVTVRGLVDEYKLQSRLETSSLLFSSSSRNTHSLTRVFSQSLFMLTVNRAASLESEFWFVMIVVTKARLRLLKFRWFSNVVAFKNYFQGNKATELLAVVNRVLNGLCAVI